MTTTLRGALESIFGAPLDPQTYRNLAYLLLSVPVGFVAFLLLTVGASLTLGLSVTLLGPAVFLLALVATLALAWLDARLTDRLLGVDLGGPSLPSGTEGGVDYVATLVTSRDVWLSPAYLCWRACFGFVGLLLLTTGASLAVGFLVAPLAYGDFLLVNYRVGVWTVDTFPRSLAAAALGLFVGLLTLLGTNLLAAAGREVATVAFGTVDDTDPAADASA